MRFSCDFIKMIFVFGPSLAQISATIRHQPSVIEISHMQPCCAHIDDHESLVACSNKSAEINMDVVVNRMSHSGPTFGFALVTYATDNIWEYAAYSIGINEIYAEHNGYVLLPVNPLINNFEKYDPRWNKVKILELALHPENGWARDFDYLMWIDADLIFLDMGMRLEQIAAENPQAHIIVSAEHAGSTTLMNSGSILVRNSKWTREFLRDWWEYADRTLYSDQEQFDLLYRSKSKDLVNKIAILPPDALNSDPPPITSQKPYNQILHLMGEHSRYRAKVFRSAFQELCRHVTMQHPIISEPVEVAQALKVSVLAPQLNCSIENLQAWSLECYSDLQEELTELFVSKMSYGGNDDKDSYALLNSMHHYALALETIAQPGEMQRATALRNQTYLYLHNNMERRRMMYKNARESSMGVQSIPKEWPEMLKYVCEAARHMISRGTSQEKKIVGAEILRLLNELYDICVDAQRPPVLRMFASLYIDLGMIDYHDHDLDSALAYFSKSLKIFTTLTQKYSFGEQVLALPMAPMANSYAQLQQYDKAFYYFQRCVELTEEHLGRYHNLLADYLLNYAVAKYFNGQNEESAKLLIRAWEIVNKNMRRLDDKTRLRIRQLYGEILQEGSSGG